MCHDAIIIQVGHKAEQLPNTINNHTCSLPLKLKWVCNNDIIYFQGNSEHFSRLAKKLIEFMDSVQDHSLLDNMLADNVIEKSLHVAVSLK